MIVTAALLADTVGWSLAGELGTGVALTLIGAVFALDLGGFTAWHSRISYDLVSFLRHIPPWRWLVKADRETLIRRQTRQTRFTGGVFVAVGVYVVIVSVVGVL